MGKRRHVAILVETSREYGRGLLRGICQYTKEHKSWSIYYVPQGLGDPPPPWLPDWKGDGILARINNRKMAEVILNTGLPAIDLRSTVVDLHTPRLGPANEAISRLAFEHLLERSFQHFGFVSISQDYQWFLEKRRQHFKKLVEEAGFEYHEFALRRKLSRTVTWEEEQERISGWLHGLPKPIGIMTGNDEIGQQVLDASMRAGVTVPDDVAVVSVDNDEYLCSLSSPTLSSIDVNLEQIGYAAATMLEKLMNGEKPKKQYSEFFPKGLAIRESTDVFAVNNVDVVAALKFIRKHACDPISVDQVVQKLAISRSTLERLFRELLGRSPKEEIARMQINRAKDLLANSELPLSIIAEKSGFCTPSRFSSTFRNRVGILPREYRKQFNTSIHFRERLRQSEKTGVWLHDKM